ncbi:uncharacterized protein [Euphorbia lathyris]|uniref:uncharacterized protein n=1 Tax=Euphorbia lathyris TaxID=212925 RepID=UPI003313DD11
MEPAKIDWKLVESIFEEDKLYENINAPKWVDFLNPEDEEESVDDESWFCRPDCKHPKIAEDFFRSTPTKKLLCSSEKLKTPFGNWNPRDAKTKRSETCSEDGEKKKAADDDERPKLKSSLSMRNLFAGKDILGHISELCNELKKMASRARDVSMEVDLMKAKEKGRPRRLKRAIDDAESENTPPSRLNVKQKGLLSIRTNPPSPQCFSGTSKASRPRIMQEEERGVLQQVNHQSSKEEIDDDGKEAKALDVFWFLNPCTLST